MANRVLRDWTTSEAVSGLTSEAERLFTRLIMKADDYGSFFGNPKLIKAALFPLNEIKDLILVKWLDECVEAGLIFRYKVDGKEYIRIKNFNQRLRNMRSTFPQPKNNLQQVAADRRGSPPETETKRNETEEETETETETETKAIGSETPPLTVWPSFTDFWELYDKKIDKPKCEKKWEKINQWEREKILEHLGRYVQSTPDIQYRKNPLTYLNSESWNNEIILPADNHGKQRLTEIGSNERINSYNIKI